MTSPSTTDRQTITAELVAALRGRIDDLSIALLGEPNRPLSGKRELRFGSKGAVRVWIAGPRRGGWADFSGDAKGDPLGLIKYARQCDFPAALAWARAWLGWPDDDGQPAPVPIQALPIHERADDAAEAERRADIARRFWQASEPLAGTLAERYLVEVRTIPPANPWPAPVHFHRGTRSLILAATTEDGTIRAVQMVRLTTSARVVLREDGGKLKISRGALAGVAVRLPGRRDSPLLLAEGPETGLSVWRATGWETWITLGSMARVVLPPDRPVIVCADDDLLRHPDPRKVAAARALAKAVQQWREFGHVLTVATPNATRQQDKTDFNDLLRFAGIDAVRARLDAANADLHHHIDARKCQIADRIIPHAIADLLTGGRKSRDVVATADQANANAGGWLTTAEVHAACRVARDRQERLSARQYRRRAA